MFAFNFLLLCGESPTFVYKFSLVNFETRICVLYILCGAIYIIETTELYLVLRVLLSDLFELYKHPIHILLEMISGMKYTTKVKSGISIPYR